MAGSKLCTKDLRCCIVQTLWKHRCKDERYNAILQEIRTARPGMATFWKLRRRSAWYGRPTTDAIRELLRRFPHTTILTVSRMGAAEVNELVKCLASTVVENEVRVMAGYFAECMGTVLSGLRSMGIPCNIAAWGPCRDTNGERFVVHPTYILLLGPVQACDFARDS